MHQRTASSLEDLVAYFRSGHAAGDGPSQMVGMEVEFASVMASTAQATRYDGDKGIRALLLSIADMAKLEVHKDQDSNEPIGLGPPPDTTSGPSSFSFSIEPGGQVEYAGPAHPMLADVILDAARTCTRMASCADSLDQRLLPLGIQPVSTCADMTMVPKGRYGIMLPYFRNHGQDAHLAESMMKQTVSIQVSLDYTDEADMVEKCRVATLLGPFMGAIFAASPISEGRLNGHASRRLEIWRHTDASRCGPLHIALKPDFGFEAYARYALGVPMMFRRLHDESLVAAEAQPFPQPGQPYPRGDDGNAPANLMDWELHLTGIFTDVRVKRHIEIRVADACGQRMAFAVPAFLVGILYHPEARAAALSLLEEQLAPQELAPLMAEVATDGLEARLRGTPIRDIAAELVRLADGGLRAREQAGSERPGTARLLEPLMERVVDGRGSLAEELVNAWEGRLQRDPVALCQAYGLPHDQAAQLEEEFRGLLGVTDQASLTDAP